MSKHKQKGEGSRQGIEKKRGKASFGRKLKDFFFPEHFGAEVAKGMYISSPYGISAIVGKVLFGLGRLARKVIDPRHKMFEGKGKHDKT